jgi:hypothetical protein
MKRCLPLWAAVGVALSSPAAAQDGVFSAFLGYQRNVRCAAKLVEKKDGSPDCKPAGVKVEVAVALADDLSAKAQASISAFSETDRKGAEAKLKELANTLQLVKVKLKASPPPAPRGSAPTPAPAAPAPAPRVVESFKLIDHGSKAHGREMPTLYAWTDGATSNYYVRTGKDDLIEIQPRMYRSFLRDYLDVPREIVSGELPPEMVRDDIQKLVEKLHTADGKTLMKFGDLFPIHEGSSVMTYLKETTDPADVNKLKSLAEVQTSVAAKTKQRLEQYSQAATRRSFDDYDQSATMTEWLSKRKPRDAWLVRDLLRDNEVDLTVRSADGQNFTVPVRPGKRLDVSDRNELRIDGVRFKPEQLKELHSPSANER